MKTCPICHKEYDDSYSFCTKDGHQLIDAEAPQNQSSQNTDKKKKSYLKKIAIAVIIVIIGLVILFSHLMKAATYIRTEPDEINASKAGGRCKVEIDYDGYVWTVNHKPDWVYLYENDQDFDLTIEPNLTGQVRNGSITVQSGKQLAQVVIKQNAFASYLRASETSIKFGQDGGEKTIAIETDGCDWEAEYTDWMDVSLRGEGVLLIKCPRNDGEYRTGTVTLKEDYVRSTIYVKQSGKCDYCHGEGRVLCSSCMGMGGFGYGYYYSPCMMCGGDGKVKCGVCNGSGYRD